MRLWGKNFVVILLLSLNISILSFSTSAVADEAIPNFHKASEGVYRGGRPSLEGLRYFKNLKIKTVINLQGIDSEHLIFGPIAEWFQPGEDPENIRKEKLILQSMGINFWSAPVSSFASVDQDTDRLIDQTLQIMRDGQPVFIHCEHGKDRTGLLVALYRVKYENWDPMDAYTEWTQHGHGWLLLLSDELDEYFFMKAYRIQSES